MRRALRWLKRIVLGVLALAVLAVAIAIGLIHTSWGRNQVRAQIVAALQADFPGSTIGSLGGSPFGTLVLRDVTIMARDGKPLATVAELRVQASLRPLLGKHVLVDDVRVRGVAVFLREQPPAPVTPPTGPSRPSEPSSWAITVPALAVDDARITVEYGRGPAATTETLDSVVVRAALRIPAGGAIAASADVSARWRDKPVTVTALAAIDTSDLTIRVPFMAARLGDASIVGTGITLTDTLAVTGHVRADVPAALVRELAHQELPGDATVLVAAQPSGLVTLTASSAGARVSAMVVADVAARRVSGIVEVSARDLATLSRGKTVGSGSIVAAIDATPERARGIVAIEGKVFGAVAGTSLAALDATLAGGTIVATAATDLGDATAIARVERTGETLTLTRATVVGDTRHIPGLRSGRAQIIAQGPVWPITAVTFSGTADGTQLVQNTTHIGAVHADLSGTASRQSQNVAAAIRVTDIRNGATRVPSAIVSLDATVIGETIAAVLGPHRVIAGDGSTWQGSGGTVRITPTTIAIDGIRTGTRGSTISASGTVGRFTDDLSAKVTVRGVSLAVADPTLRGTADADVDVARRGASWRGRVSARARGVTVPDYPSADVTVTATLVGRKVTIDGVADGPELGRTSLAVVVTGPRDITDVRAWQRLPRTALDELALTIGNIDAARLGATGHFDGQLTMTGTTIAGELRARGVETQAGLVDATVSIAPGADNTITVHAEAVTPEVPPAIADMTIVLPARPFDPTAWRALGRGALRGATLRTGTVHVDTALLARLGLDEPYRADVTTTVVVGPGAMTATVTSDVRGLEGGKLMAPVNLTFEATTDTAGTRATVAARSGVIAATVDASTPLTIAGVLSGGMDHVRASKIDAVVTVPDMAARDLLGLLGDTDVLSGTVGAKVTLDGTVAAPRIRAQVLARNLAMKPGLSSRKPPKLERLEVDARLSAGRADVTVSGTEGPGRLLEITAYGNPADPRSINASIQAANFDIAPLTAFGTGALRAARGTLNAALKIRGLDPRTGSIRGQLALKDGRFPLSPELGTLRRASVEVDVVGKQLIAKLDGRLGAGGGSVTGTLTSQIVGGMPMSAHLDMALKKVSPIGALQPVVDAQIVGNWTNTNNVWTGSLAIRDANIFVPPETGSDLLITGAPSDMIFIDKTLVKKKVRQAAAKPWLITTVALGTTNVEVQDTDFGVRVTARGKLEVAIGDGMTVKGTIFTTRGTVDALGRRYRVENAILDFDGQNDPADPLLDIKIVHEFKTLTLTVDVRGRPSNPDVRMTGDPGTYTEGQLLSFFAGAEPGRDDSTSQANQAVVSGSLSILSGRVGKKLNKYLPVKFDLIDYEAGNSTSSKAVRFGIRLGDKSNLIWRQRLAARPDENPGEAVFEYQFRQNLLFEGTIGERAKGGDFLWRRRW